MSDAQAKPDPEAIDWQQWQPTMRATLLFVRRDDEVLLIEKKRGLGAGKVNAPGGKIDPGETPLQAAVREVSEEVKLTVSDPVEMGVLRFQFVDGEKLALHCTVFIADKFTGEAAETDEADPFWCPIDAVPYERMWADDRHWLPGMLAGGTFAGEFIFDDETMLWHDLRWF